MKQERRLEDMMAELHEAVSELPPPAPTFKVKAGIETFYRLSDSIEQLGAAFAESFSEALNPISQWVRDNGGDTWIDDRTRWQKIKDKVTRR